MKRKLKDFDAVKEVERLKAQTKIIRKRNYSKRRSMLDTYDPEIKALLKSGAKPAEIHRWLMGIRVNVAQSTLSRWLARNTPSG